MTMKELMAYYNRKNLIRGFLVGLVMTVIFFIFGADSVLGLVLIFLLTMFSTPAVMARNAAIAKWEGDNWMDRL